MALRVELVNTAAGFCRLKSGWDKLAARVPRVLPTQTHAYINAYLQSFDGVEPKLCVYVFYQHDQLVAVLPCEAASRRVVGLSFPIRPGLNLPMPIRDVLVAPEIELQALLECLRAQGDHFSRWLYMGFKAVPEDSCLVDPQRINGTAVLSRTSGSSNAIDVSVGGYHERVLSRSFRSDLRRKLRRLQKHGKVEFFTIDEQPELESAFADFLDTEAAGWKSVSGGKRAVKLHADQTQFYRQLMRTNAHEQTVQIHLLKLDGEAIASDFCILSQGVSYSLKHGYNEEYQWASPGNLLRSYSIEYYEQRADIQILDLISSWGWHERWHPQSRQIFEIKVFSGHWMARLIYNASVLRQRLRR